MSLQAIRRIAEERLGLDVESLGIAAFMTAVEAARRTSGETDWSRYAERLQRDPIAFETFAEHLVVNETWFYRGGTLFEFLARRAVSIISSGKSFRALCLPCSSGEEPYSLAIALIEANVLQNWEIDGVDVSPRAIAAARQAVYRDFSFRQCPAWVRERYFRAVPAGWELNRDVRDRVRFRVGNVLDTPTGASYDLILCRNLLIYLTPAARRSAIENLVKQLAPDGWIGVGHAEPSVFADRAFEPVGPAEYFLYFPTPHTVAPSPGGESSIPRPVPLFPSTPPTPSAVSRANSTKPPPTHVPAQEAPSLERARGLANAGNLSQALALCRDVITRTGPSADAFALLGVLLQASGETTQAADALRRALYLDPEHAEALAHSMLMNEAAGRSDQANSFRARLARTGGQQ